MVKKRYLVILGLTMLFASDGIAQPTTEPKGGTAMKLIVKSSAFQEGAMIPKPYTCDGRDVSPPLEWDTPPDGTKSLALICDDPDAPMGTWVHWVLYDLPPHVRELPENVPLRRVLENGAKQGNNDFRTTGYGGPCPPRGTHRYFFKLYALDIVLNLDPGQTKAVVLDAMAGHVLAEGALMGRYKR
ncbi:MAG: YbhB/YbcL family Raf kinase inhibitor-like protein [Deltaproteobacteria bacterium]|nr:YbhB/YbcL family Raf kinase inhibitor-like protein [Deltaproteobacteria bacterium]